MTWILRKTIAPNGKRIFIQLHGHFSSFSLLPKVETCFPISFMNELFISTDAYIIEISEVDGHLQSAGT